MSYGNKLDLVRQFSPQVLQIQGSILEIDIDKLSSSLTAGFLPRNDVEWCSMTEIKTWSPSVRISSAKRATQLRLVVVPLVKRTSFVDPALINLRMVFTSSFIGCCRPFRQGMNTTVNIGIVLLIVAVDYFQYC